MRPTFLSFKSINISWFMVIAVLAILVSYLLLKLISNHNAQGKEDKEKTKDILFWVIISGFVGARIIYVLLHLNAFRASPISMLKITHYNLSLIGGIIGGVLTLLISSKKYEIKLYKLLDIFCVLFYFAMSIGVWNFLFDAFMLSSSNLGKVHIRIMIMSLLFLIAAAVQVIIEKRFKFKYISLIILILTIILYYTIKLG